MDTNQFERPILTVDVALFTLLSNQLHVLLMQRDRPPFEGRLALPGGYVHINEDVNSMQAARRVVRDKLAINVSYLEQLSTFDGLMRDPRGWSASIAYIAVIKPSRVTFKNAQEFYPVDNLPKLAFDHNRIITEALMRLRNKTNYSSLPLFLMPAKFTLYDLRMTYEALLGSEVNKGTFRKRVMEQGIVEPTGEKEDTSEHRPAELFRASGRTLTVFKEIR